MAAAVAAVRANPPGRGFAAAMAAQMGGGFGAAFFGGEDLGVHGEDDY